MAGPKKKLTTVKKKQAESGGESVTREVESTDKRQAIRFPVIQRVDYELGDRKTFNYSTDLSARGLFLRNTKGLEMGTALELHLNLKGRKTPLMVRGTVRRMTAVGREPGVGIEFSPGQDEVVAEIRTFLEQEVVSKLEDTIRRSLTSASTVVQVAAYYLETGRRQDALDLCRRGVQASPKSLPLNEMTATLMLSELDGPGRHDEALLDEAEALVERGIALGASPVLEAVKARVAGMRGVLARERREAAEREDAARRQRDEDEARKARDAIAHEVAIEAAHELQTRKKELETEYQQRAKAETKQHAEMRKVLTLEQTALATERETVQALEHELAKREQKLAKQEAKIAERETSLKSEETAAQSLARELAKQGKEVQRRAEAVDEAEKLAAALETTRIEHAAVVKALHQVRAELGESQRDGEKLRTGLAKAESRHAALTKQVADEQTAREGALAAEHAQVLALKKQLREVQQGQQQAEQQRTEALARVEQLELDKADLARAQETAREKLTATKSTVLEARQAAELRIAELEEAVSSTRKKADLATKELDAARAQVGALQSETNDRRQELERLRATLTKDQAVAAELGSARELATTAQAAREQLATDLALLQKTAATVQIDRDQLASELETLRAASENAQTRLETQLRQAHGAAASWEDEKRAAQRLREELDSAQASMRQLSQQRETLERSLAARSAELENARLGAEASSSELRARVLAANAERSTLAARVGTLEAELRGLREQIEHTRVVQQQVAATAVPPSAPPTAKPLASEAATLAEEPAELTEDDIQLVTGSTWTSLRRERVALILASWRAQLRALWRASLPYRQVVAKNRTVVCVGAALLVTLTSVLLWPEAPPTPVTVDAIAGEIQAARDVVAPTPALAPTPVAAPAPAPERVPERVPAAPETGADDLFDSVFGDDGATSERTPRNP